MIFSGMFPVCSEGSIIESGETSSSLPVLFMIIIRPTTARIKIPIIDKTLFHKNSNLDNLIVFTAWVIVGIIKNLALIRIITIVFAEINDSGTMITW